MTNVKQQIVDALVDALSGIHGLRTGLYPRDCAIAGVNPLLALVQAGNSEYSYGNAGLLICDMQFIIHLYTDDGKNALQTMTDLHADVMGVVLGDVTLGGVVDCIRALTDETGDWMSEYDVHSAGYTENLTNWKITLAARYRVEA